MKTLKYLLLAFAFSLVLTAHCVAQDVPQEQPPKYRMELVYIFESHTTEFIFTIGAVGFKSVESLKRFLSTVPSGSVLEWAPGCRRMGSEPLLSSEQEMQDFKDFCEAHNIKFVLIPSG